MKIVEKIMRICVYGSVDSYFDESFVSYLTS